MRNYRVWFQRGSEKKIYVDISANSYKNAVTTAYQKIQRGVVIDVTPNEEVQKYLTKNYGKVR